MRKIQFRRGLPWVLAAAMVAALPGAFTASAASSNSAAAQMLGAQLPPNLTLAKANCEQTASALSAAVGQRPDIATDLTRAAVLARTPKQGHGELSCMCLKKITAAAVRAAPDRGSEIVQMALSLHPECSDSLDDLLLTDQDLSPTDLYGGFGVGFGPGFPGSPGFTGSPPSGATALPTPTAETTVING